MSPQAPINASMSIPEIVEKYPHTKAVFAQYGLHVDGYVALQHEDLSATIRVHQINLENLLRDLNQATTQ